MDVRLYSGVIAESIITHINGIMNIQVLSYGITGFRKSGINMPRMIEGNKRNRIELLLKFMARPKSTRRERIRVNKSGKLRVKVLRVLVKCGYSLIINSWNVG